MGMELSSRQCGEVATECGNSSESTRIMSRYSCAARPWARAVYAYWAEAAVAIADLTVFSLYRHELRLAAHIAINNAQSYDAPRSPLTRGTLSPANSGGGL
jgi:hypothetical protein